MKNSESKDSKKSKLMTKMKWLLYSGVALNTMLLIAAIADDPKNPRYIGE